MPHVDLLTPLFAFAAAQVVRWVVWGGLVALTIAMLVLARTRWGQSQPLGKCIVLSLLAHLLLALYATTVGIMIGGGGDGNGDNVTVSILDGSGSADAGEGTGGAWDGLPSSSTTGADAPSAGDDSPHPDDAPTPDRSPVRPVDLGAKLPLPVATQDDAVPSSAAAAKGADRPAQPAEPIETQPASRQDAPGSDVPAPTDAVANDSGSADEPNQPRPSGRLPVDLSGESGPLGHADDDITSGSTSRTGKGRLQPAPPAGAADGDPNGTGSAGGSPNGGASGQGVPGIYSARTGGDRAGAAKRHGGNADTEAAVEAALKWLADNQSRDGRWDANRLGAGRGALINGQDRRGVGGQADTGLTGLALLAFLAAGNTHERGTYAKTVQHGLEYLLAEQAADGNLFGSAALYEKMYCHAMAAFALSEAYAMTRDDRLRPAVVKAVEYSARAQHRASGGWRYQPNTEGDTSQLGWQVMFLKSAELAGVATPSTTRSGIERFLGSVSTGKQGGLASYRPGLGASRPMTAEALVCHQFLGMRQDHPAAAEASQYLLEELPGQREVNHYYLYYGTLAMFQLQGEGWQRWNEALQKTLLTTQRRSGDLTGSWDPDTTWGACGGRVYSTALSALCLEVYYRYLPLYVEAAGVDRTMK